MKKKKFKALFLNKKSISKLQSNSLVGRAGTDWPNSVKLCPKSVKNCPDPAPDPTPGGGGSNTIPVCPSIFCSLVHFPGCI